GCVRDDDAPPRRRIDVDVVDTDSRPADDLQPLASFDELGGELRRGADDDRVVRADDLRELGRAVDVDVELRPQKVDAGLGGRLREEDVHQAGTACAYASYAAGTATPRSIGIPSSTSASSTAPSAAVMSKRSNQPQWPIRKIFPFRCAWPLTSVTP